MSSSAINQELEKKKQELKPLLSKLWEQSNYSDNALQRRTQPINYKKKFDEIGTIVKGIPRPHRSNEMSSQQILEAYSLLPERIDQLIESDIKRKSQNILYNEKESVLTVLQEQKRYTNVRKNVPTGVSDDFLMKLADNYNIQKEMTEKGSDIYANPLEIGRFEVDGMSLDTLFDTTRFGGNYHDIDKCGPDTGGIVFDGKQGEKYRDNNFNSAENVAIRRRNLELIARFWKCYVGRINIAIECLQNRVPDELRGHVNCQRGGHTFAIQYCQDMLNRLLNFVGASNSNKYTTSRIRPLFDRFYTEAVRLQGEAYAKKYIGSTGEHHSETITNPDVDFDGRIKVGVRIKGVEYTTEQINAIKTNYESSENAILNDINFYKTILELIKSQASVKALISNIILSRRNAFGSRENLEREIMFNVRSSLIPSQSKIEEFVPQFFEKLAKLYLNIYFINQGFTPSQIFGEGKGYDNFKSIFVGKIKSKLLEFYGASNVAEGNPFTKEYRDLVNLRFKEQEIPSSSSSSRSAPLPIVQELSRSPVKRYVSSAPSILFSTIPLATKTYLESLSQSGGKRRRTRKYKRRNYSTRKRRM